MPLSGISYGVEDRRAPLRWIQPAVGLPERSFMVMSRLYLSGSMPACGDRVGDNCAVGVAGDDLGGVVAPGEAGQVHADLHPALPWAGTVIW